MPGGIAKHILEQMEFFLWLMKILHDFELQFEKHLRQAFSLLLLLPLQYAKNYTGTFGK